MIRLFRRDLYLLLIVVFCISACQTGLNRTPTETPDLNSIISNSSASLLELKSTHFLMEITGRPTYLDYPPTLALKYVEGDIIKPDRMQAIVRISSFGTITEVAIKEIDGQQYITNPLNQLWEVVSQQDKWYFNPAYFFDSEIGLARLVARTNWDYLPVEESDDKGLYHFKAVVDGEELYAITAGMITEGEVHVEIWISEDSGDLMKIQMIEVDSDAENPTKWYISLSEKNQDIRITKPEVSQ